MNMHSNMIGDRLVSHFDTDISEAFAARDVLASDCHAVITPADDGGYTVSIHDPKEDEIVSTVSGLFGVPYLARQWANRWVSDVRHPTVGYLS